MGEIKKDGNRKQSLKELRKRIRAAYEAEKWEKVKLLCETIFSEYPDDVSGEDYFHYGRYFLEKSEYDKAIECYQKALDTPDYDTPGKAWYNMGIAYSSKGDNDKAIECYQKALDTPDYDTPGYTWYNKGLTLRAKGDDNSLVKAESCFKEAANWFRGINRTDDAENAEGQAKLVLVERAVGKKKAAELYPALYSAKGKTPDSDLGVVDPTEELQALEKESMNALEEYKRSFEKRTDNTIPKNALILLKGWSSSDPFFASALDSRSNMRGGGIFIRWMGKGIVVDPGIDFLMNFHRHGCFVQDIDGIVITHDHIDHYFDMEAIDNLIYKLFQSENKRKRFCFFAKPVHDKHEELHGSPCYLFCSAFEDDVVGPGSAITHDVIKGISISPFKTRHTQHSFGIRCELADSDHLINIGITSDAYAGSQEVRKGLTKNLHDCDLIVAHISSPDAKELEDPDHFKKKPKHLGLNGTRYLIAHTEAQVYIITEFWAGFGERRVSLCQKLAYDLERENKITGKSIIPADVGLTILLETDGKGSPRFKIKCTSEACGREVDCREITVVRPDKSYGPIRYVCPTCMKRLTIPMR